MRSKSQRKRVSPTDSGSYHSIDDEIENINGEIFEILNPGIKILPPPTAKTLTVNHVIDDQEVTEIKQSNLRATTREVKDSDSQNSSNSVTPKVMDATHDLRDPTEEERIVAARIKNVFAILTDQIDEFKKRFQEATEKLWLEEDRNAVLEEKIDVLEEEKIVLIEANIRAREDAKTGRIFIPVTTVANVTAMNKDLRGDAIRRGLLFDDYEENGALSFDVLYGGGAKGFASAILKVFILKVTPFRSDIRKITAQFGSSVASFFIFYRFIFLQSILIGVLAATFTFFHIINVVRRGDKVIIRSKGLLPGFMMYSSFEKSEQIYYVAIVIVGLAISFFFLLFSYIREDLRSKEQAAIEEENTYIYGNDCFCAWDFSVASNVEADDYCGSLTQKYCLLLSETKSSGMKDLRSSADLLSLYCRRVIGFTLYFLVQSISFVLIILVTFNQNNVSRTLQGISGVSSDLMALLAQIIPPALLTTINYITPELFTRITQLEQWDNVSTEINMLLFRMYCSSTLNLLLLAFSYALLANPFLLGDQALIRNNLAIKSSKVFDCPMDQTANGLFTLVVFSFVIKAAAMLLVPVLMICKARLTLIPFKKFEFAIAHRIVETLNLISVVFLSFPFAPLSLIFLPFFLFCTLKWEKYTTLMFQTKPKRPWKAQKAGSVFTMFYLISLITIGIPSGIFFLATKTFPKNCDIQDENVFLCSSAVINNVCSTDNQSPYYYLYGRAAVQYPSNICSRSCGAFVDVTGSNIQPLVEALQENTVVLGMLDALFYYPYLPWILTLVLLVIVRLRNNSVGVFLSHSESKERALKTRILTLEGEQKRQAKIIGRMRSIEREEESAVSPTHHDLDQKFKPLSRIKPPVT